MGLFGDIENAVGDVVHAGESVVSDITGMISSLAGFITDAGLGDVVHELEQLADQANQLRQELQSAEGSTQWHGAAADAFRQQARQRLSQTADLVTALDAAHSAVAAAYAIAGIF